MPPLSPTTTIETNVLVVDEQAALAAIRMQLATALSTAKIAAMKKAGEREYRITELPFLEEELTRLERQVEDLKRKIAAAKAAMETKPVDTTPEIETAQRHLAAFEQAIDPNNPNAQENRVKILNTLRNTEQFVSELQTTVNAYLSQPTQRTKGLAAQYLFLAVLRPELTQGISYKVGTISSPLFDQVIQVLKMQYGIRNVHNSLTPDNERKKWIRFYIGEAIASGLLANKDVEQYIDTPVIQEILNHTHHRHS